MKQTSRIRAMYGGWCFPVIAALALTGGILPIGAQLQPAEPGKTLVLQTTTMCEAVEDFRPITPAVVFSAETGQVACYTIFDPVPEKNIIYHNWYRRDVLNTKVRLLVRPPRWRTFSKIQLRASDKGPWRVDITDADGKVLGVTRFSIVD